MNTGVYPWGAYATSTYHSTACFSETTDPNTGAPICLSDLKTAAVIDSGEYAIIHGWSTSADRLTRSDLFCGNRLVDQVTQNNATNLTHIKCRDGEDIKTAAKSGTNPSVFNHITYSVASTTMSTTSPYTIQEWNSGIYNYTYNPLISQIGIFIWVFTFLFFIYGITKIFVKR